MQVQWQSALLQWVDKVQWYNFFFFYIYIFSSFWISMKYIINQKVQPATRAYIQLLQRALASGQGFFTFWGNIRFFCWLFLLILGHFLLLTSVYQALRISLEWSSAAIHFFNTSVYTDSSHFFFLNISIVYQLNLSGIFFGRHFLTFVDFGGFAPQKTWFLYLHQ